MVFDLIPYFHPLKIVCHPSFDERYYVSCDDLWLENSVNFWRQLIPAAGDGGTVIALENVYEREPRILRVCWKCCLQNRFVFALTRDISMFSPVRL
jgi:hypothetical protein